jgi:hypothetical protein
VKVIKAYFSGRPMKSTIGVLVMALLVGGISAQASGVLNSPSGGYLICVDSKTKLITHPGTSSCPKGSKRLVIGAAGKDGATGLTGAAGLNGLNGKDGKDGKTLWNGVKDPESTWGAPGDMFINSVTRTLFGPKNLDGTWPAGVSMVGPKGDQGPIGLTGAQGPIGLTGAAGVAAPVATGTNCIGAKCTYKIGDTGPGGGWIFFVDYNDQYAGFSYLEAAPSSCEAMKTWSSAFTSVPAVAGWRARAVGAGSTNTVAIKAVFTSDNSTNNAAHYATACSAGSKNDWFLGSLGEIKLMYDNLQGLGDLVESNYWSSSEAASGYAWFLQFYGGDPRGDYKTLDFYVRPVRAF